jgi:hypothetical protein
MNLGPGREEARLVTKDRRIWTSVTRPGRLVEKPGREFDIGLTRYRLGPIRLTRAGMLAFPTDPQTIYKRLNDAYQGNGHSREGEMFTEIGDALRETAVPAGLRAGLYGALALIPGVELVGDVTDRAGRHGTAVAFTEVGMRNELIFDPATSEMLAERTVLLDPAAAEIPLPKGTVIGDSAYLERAVVDELPG